MRDNIIGYDILKAKIRSPANGFLLSLNFFGHIKPIFPNTFGHVKIVFGVLDLIPMIIKALVIKSV